jgi:hypothetical protein
MYIGKVCMQKHQRQQHATATATFALANRYDPICVAAPKVAKASTVVTVACCCRWHFQPKNFANRNTALGQSPSSAYKYQARGESG